MRRCRRLAGLLLPTVLALSLALGACSLGCGKYGKPVRKRPSEKNQTLAPTSIPSWAQIELQAQLQAQGQK